MAPSDLDITRTAHQWIQQHGDDATMKAREMVEKRCADGATPTAPTPGCGSSWRPGRWARRRQRRGIEGGPPAVRQALSAECKRERLRFGLSAGSVGGRLR
jgi:hypothetical protein